MIELINTIKESILYKYLVIPKNKRSFPIKLIGVGPGDSSLITIGAIKAIKQANVIAYPISSFGSQSISAKIASKYIRYKKHLPIVFPMSNTDSHEDTIWNNAAQKLLDEANSGKRVALICLGDASLFSSATQIFFRLEKLYDQLEIIPGVTSISAAASLSKFPIGIKGEQILIAETPDSLNKFEELINEAESKKRVICLLKLGKRWPWVKSFLKANKLLNNCIICVRIGFEDQLIVNAEQFQEDKLPYFSLLLLRF
mgnify:CR=1 FL=1|tara:strand:- start:1690 stop:2460 length:771 start_codon:yes stop_codon:yes gene_type:complete